MIDKLIEPVTHILDKFVADKDLKAKLDHEIKTQFHKIDLAQIEVNKVEPRLKFSCKFITQRQLLQARHRTVRTHHQVNNCYVSI